MWFWRNGRSEGGRVFVAGRAGGKTESGAGMWQAGGTGGAGGAGGDGEAGGTKGVTAPGKVFLRDNLDACRALGRRIAERYGIASNGPLAPPDE